MGYWYCVRHCFTCLIYDSLEDELGDFVDYLRDDNMDDPISEGAIMSNSEETICRIYKDKVKDTAIHELTELYVKIELLSKSLGFDIKSQMKAYVYYKKHDKK